MDNAIDFLILICWIVTYPVDSAVHRLNNRGQEIRIAGDERSTRSVTSMIRSNEIKMGKMVTIKRIVMLLPTGRVNYKVAYISLG